jgi:hypothetical protein
MWAAYVFVGRPTPVEPEAFRLVAALDLAVLAPALGFGGVLIWTRQPWAVVVGPMVAILGALYLVVLSVNSLIAIRRGFVAFPGELPLWATLAAITTAAALVLLRSRRR